MDRKRILTVAAFVLPLVCGGVLMMVTQYLQLGNDAIGLPLPEYRGSAAAAAPGAWHEVSSQPRIAPAPQHAPENDLTAAHHPTASAASRAAPPDHPPGLAAIAATQVQNASPATPAADDVGSDQGDSEPVLHAISGMVMNESGDPLPGIEVVATVSRLFPGPDGFVPIWAEAEHSSWSDAAGVYTLGGLSDGEYLVYNQPIVPYQTTRLMVRAGADSANLLLTEAREVWVYGTVKEMHGNPVAAARVEPFGRPADANYSDAKGQYGLYVTMLGRDRDHNALHFSHDGYREQLQWLRRTNLTAADELRLDIQLTPVEALVAVSGRVIASDDAAPVDGARVLLVAQQMPNRHQAVTDPAGKFVIAAVVADADYQLMVLPDAGYRDYSASALAVGAEGLDLLIELEPLGRGRLEGRMVDLAGTPVPGFSLWLSNNSARDHGAVPVASDHNGNFVVADATLGELSFASRSSPQLRINGIHRLPGENEPIQLTLDWGSYELAGRVVDALDSPVPGAQVTLRWSHELSGMHSLSIRNTTADAGGFFRFTRLGPGPHTLGIQAPGFHSARLDHDVSNAGPARVELEADSAAESW